MPGPAGVDDAVQNLGKLFAKIDGNNGGRRFVGSQTVIVARTNGSQAQGRRMAVYAPQHGRQEDEKLGVVPRRGAGIEQVLPFGIAERPVVVLAAAVDARKGLFMQQAEETVTRRYVAQQVHGKHIVIAGDIGLFIDRRKLELAGSHLVVTRLCRNPQGDQRVFHILHETHDAGGNGAEIVILHFLTLGGGRAQQGAAGQQQIGTQCRQLPVDKKIFLFRADHGRHPVGRFVAKQPQNAHRLTRQGVNGADQRNLAIQRLAGIGIEKRGNMQRRRIGAPQDEGGN